MSYEAWRREVEMGRMPDWSVEKNDYEWDPLNPPPERRPSGKFPVVIPKELRDDAKKK